MMADSEHFGGVSGTAIEAASAWARAVMLMENQLLPRYLESVEALRQNHRLVYDRLEETVGFDEGLLDERLVKRRALVIRLLIGQIETIVRLPENYPEISTGQAAREVMEILTRFFEILLKGFPQHIPELCADYQTQSRYDGQNLSPAAGLQAYNTIEAMIFFAIEQARSGRRYQKLVLEVDNRIDQFGELIKWRLFT